MANYPGAIDSAASLYSPVDAFSGEAPGDDDHGRGPGGRLRRSTSRPRPEALPRRYGILSIDDELIVYTGKTGDAVHRVPAWGVRDRRRRPQQRRGGEGEHGRGLHHRAPVGGPGHRERVGHRRRAQLRPEGRRGHGHRPQDVPGRRGVRRRARRLAPAWCACPTLARSSGGSRTTPATSASRSTRATTSRWTPSSTSRRARPSARSRIRTPRPLAKGIVQIDAGRRPGGRRRRRLARGHGVTPGTYTKTTVDQKGRVTAGASLLAGDLPGAHPRGVRYRRPDRCRSRSRTTARRSAPAAR